MKKQVDFFLDIGGILLAGTRIMFHVWHYGQHETRLEGHEGFGSKNKIVP